MPFLANLYKFTLPLFVVAWLCAWVSMFAVIAPSLTADAAVIFFFMVCSWAVVGIFGPLSIVSLLYAWRHTPVEQVDWHGAGAVGGTLILFTSSCPALYAVFASGYSLFNIWTQGLIISGVVAGLCWMRYCSGKASADEGDDSEEARP